MNTDRKNKNFITDKRCQVFTPDYIVDEMLDICEYTDNLIGKRVLENSFGDGAILCKIVERYILAAIRDECSSQIIKKGLEQDIWGFEIDKKFFNKTIEKLNKLITQYDIKNVKWSIFNCDALLWHGNIKFDFVIGNPPYVSYRSLSVYDRKYLHDNYKSCKKGCFDYCYAFIEKGISCLKDTGKLIQLIPVSVYKNESAEILRKMLVPKITTIIDYSSMNIFGKTMVASSVFVYTNDCKSDKVLYAFKQKEFTKCIDRKNFGKKWVFADDILSLSLNNVSKNSYNVFVSVATQLNSAFVVDIENVKKHRIEKSVLRKTTSPRFFSRKKELYIIFPYNVSKNGEIKRYTEQQFCNKYPYAVRYLKNYKARLSQRDADHGAKWFEYGRSQAISKMNSKKLLLSTVVTGYIKVQLLDESYIPYSGICITADNVQNLKRAKKLLESKAFLAYVKQHGTPIHGDSIRISPKDVKNWLVK